MNSSSAWDDSDFQRFCHEPGRKVFDIHNGGGEEDTQERVRLDAGNALANIQIPFFLPKFLPEPCTQVTNSPLTFIYSQSI